VGELDFTTSLGAEDQVVITDLGVLCRHDELVLEALHPGVTVEQAREATGWDLRIADDLETTDPPTADELAALRELHA
jgi:glutaconate CoA-transferase subunit B